MSDNSRMQQVKIITIWWRHYDMHGSKIFLAESVQDIIQNLSKATLWSKMTEYVENLKRKQWALPKDAKHLSKLLEGKSWLFESMPPCKKSIQWLHCSMCCVLLLTFFSQFRVDYSHWKKKKSNKLCRWPMEQTGRSFQFQLPLS